jgi:hypothetical protein
MISLSKPLENLLLHSLRKKDNGLMMDMKEILQECEVYGFGFGITLLKEPIYY